MPDTRQFKLPDVGEGLTEAEIVSWKVKPGDTVKVNDIIVEIETAKSLVELPTPYAGVVAELLVEEGQTVEVGTPIISVGGAGGAAGSGGAGQAAGGAAGAGESAAEPPPAVETPADDKAVEPGLIGGPAPGGRTSVLVGYGPRTTEAKRRPRKSGAAATPAGQSPATAQQDVQQAFEAAPAAAPAVPAEQAEEAAPAEPVDVPTARSGADGATVRALAKPPVRKLAKDLGVDLTEVNGSGPDGRILREDVEQHAAGVGAGMGAGQGAAARAPRPGERETRVPIKGVRKMTAAAMVSSAFTAPHVTEWVTVDATRTTKLVEKLRGSREFRGIKVSPLLIVARAVCVAVRRTPEVNATWDESAQEIVLKHYVNLGIAAATPRGLVVPNIPDADSLSTLELAQAIGELTATARDGKTQPAQMSGGTFTITNVGVFGVDSGTPIINPGESAILAMGAIRPQPWVVGDKIRPRAVTTLALSFDHRVVDGEQGSRFLSDLARIIEDPGHTLVL